MASYPLYGQPNSVMRWNVPPCDEQFGGYPHRSFENGAIFRTRQLPSEDIEEVTTQAAQVQAHEQTTGSGTKGKGKGKANYDKWTNEEQSFLVDLWAEKHDRLESKDARKVWQEICDEIEMNFGTKKTVEKCQRKIKYLIDKYKDAKSWNKSQTGGHIRKSVFYDKLDQVLGTRDIVTMKHVVEAGTSTASPSFPRANRLQVIMMGHSQARVERQVLQKVALLLVASVGPAVKYRMAKSIWPAPANSAGRKGSEQQRGNCQPKTPERKRHFPSRKAWNP